MQVTTTMAAYFIEISRTSSSRQEIQLESARVAPAYGAESLRTNSKIHLEYIFAFKFTFAVMTGMHISKEKESNCHNVTLYHIWDEERNGTCDISLIL